MDPGSPEGQAGGDATQAPEAGTDQQQSTAQSPPQAPEGFIEKQRYDGQVRKVGELDAENRRLKAQIAASGQTQTPPPQGDGQQQSPAGGSQQQSELTTDDMVRVLFYDYMTRTTEGAVKSALEKYPEAALFQDQIQGTTPDEIEASAKSIHDRVLTLKGRSPGEPPAQGGEPAPPAAPSGQQPPVQTTPVVTGGVPQAQQPGSLEDELRGIIARKDWAAFSAFKTEHPEVRVKPRIEGERRT